MESDSVSFTGVSGFMIHGMFGELVIPVVALLFVVVSLFAKIPGGIKWALFTLAATIVQVVLGILAHGMPALGMLHGAFALVLFGVAITAAVRVRRLREGGYGRTMSHGQWSRLCLGQRPTSASVARCQV